MSKVKPYVIAAVIVIAGILIGRLLGSGNSQQQERAVPKRNDQVPVTRVANSVVSRTIVMNGKVEAVKKIEIFAEVSGLFFRWHETFQRGAQVQQGGGALEYRRQRLP